MNADAGGWVNPYRYDGRDRARYDASDGLYWLTTRAYDPTLGRFLARDPLGRAPLFFADNPYAYAGNNPVSNVDPSGQYRAAGAGSVARESGAATNKMMARVVAKSGTPSKGCGGCKQVQLKASPPPTRYMQVMGICGGLAGLCSSLIQILGGPGILDTRDLLRNVGVLLAIVGVGLDLFDTIYTLQNAVDKGKAIGWALAALAAITSIISWLSSSTLSRSAAVYLQFGPWAQAAGDIAVTAATTAAEGEAAPVVSVLGWLGGNVVTYLLGGFASSFASIGESLVALSDK